MDGRQGQESEHRPETLDLIGLASSQEIALSRYPLSNLNDIFFGVLPLPFF